MRPNEKGEVTAEARVSDTLAEAPWGRGRIEILRGEGADAAVALKERFEAVIVWSARVPIPEPAAAESGRMVR